MIIININIINININIIINIINIINDIYVVGEKTIKIFTPRDEIP